MADEVPIGVQETVPKIQNKPRSSGVFVDSKNTIRDLYDILVNEGVFVKTEGSNPKATKMSLDLENGEKLFDADFHRGVNTYDEWNLIFKFEKDVTPPVYVSETRDAFAEQTGGGGNVSSVGIAGVGKSRCPLTVSSVRGGGDPPQQKSWVLQSKNYMKLSNTSETFFKASGVFDSDGSFSNSFCFLKNGVETPIAQSGWNLDVFDGTGGASNPSGILLDFSKIQTIIIHITNTYVGVIRFGFVVDGVFYFANEKQINNVLTEVPFSNFDCAAESSGEFDDLNIIYKFGLIDNSNGYGVYFKNESNAITQETRTLFLNSMSVYSFGAIKNEYSQIFSAPKIAEILYKPVNTVSVVPLVSIQPQIAFDSKINRGYFEIESISVAVRSADETRSVSFELIYFPSVATGNIDPPGLTGVSFVVGNNVTGIRHDVSATAIPGSGGYLIASGEAFPNQETTLKLIDESNGKNISPRFSYTEVNSEAYANPFFSVVAKAPPAMIGDEPIDAAAYITWREVF